eukprot:m.190758 g.190758  ORF g.190758 m.190758 type:complete len:65 (-) comp18570_c1_seq8:279-473(-)
MYHSNTDTIVIVRPLALFVHVQLSIRVTGASGKGEVKHFRCLKQPNGKLQLGQKVSADSVFHQL